MGACGEAMKLAELKRYEEVWCCRFLLGILLFKTVLCRTSLSRAVSFASTRHCSSGDLYRLGAPSWMLMNGNAFGLLSEVLLKVLHG